MSYQNYLLKIKKRNANLLVYHKKYPRITQQDLAKIFKISQSTVSKILARGFILSDWQRSNPPDATTSISTHFMG